MPAPTNVLPIAYNDYQIIYHSMIDFRRGRSHEWNPQEDRTFHHRMDRISTYSMAQLSASVDEDRRAIAAAYQSLDYRSIYRRCRAARAMATRISEWAGHLPDGVRVDLDDWREPVARPPEEEEEPQPAPARFVASTGWTISVPNQPPRTNAFDELVRAEFPMPANQITPETLRRTRTMTDAADDLRTGLHHWFALLGSPAIDGLDETPFDLAADEADRRTRRPPDADLEF